MEVLVGDDGQTVEASLTDVLRAALATAVRQQGRVADETWLAIVVYLIEKAIESLPQKGEQQ